MSIKGFCSMCMPRKITCSAEWEKSIFSRLCVSLSDLCFLLYPTRQTSIEDCHTVTMSQLTSLLAIIPLKKGRNPAEHSWTQPKPPEPSRTHLNRAEPGWIQPKPPDPSWIQLNLAESRWIQPKPTEPSRTHLNPAEPGWIQPNPPEPSWIQLNLAESSWIQPKPTEPSQTHMKPAEPRGIQLWRTGLYEPKMASGFPLRKGAQA